MTETRRSLTHSTHSNYSMQPSHNTSRTRQRSRHITCMRTHRSQVIHTELVTFLSRRFDGDFQRLINYLFSKKESIIWMQFKRHSTCNCKNKFTNIETTVFRVIRISCRASKFDDLPWTRTEPYRI